MADKYSTLQITPAGMNMIAKSLCGGKIVFTKIVVGNGKPEDLENITALANPKLEIGISKAEERADFILLTGNVSSKNVTEGFYSYELGVFAKDADENEHLYAYRYNQEDADYFPTAESSRTMELTMSIVAQLGNAENVTAVLVEGDAYAKVNHTHDIKDLVSGVLPVELGGTGTASPEESDLAKVRTVKIPADGWTYSEPYTQTVNVDGVTASQSPVISCGMPEEVTAENVKAMKKAFGMIDRGVTGDGIITFFCYNKRPQKDIIVLVKGV